MPKFRRKPLVVEAVQWFKHGDHPAVERRPDWLPGMACGWLPVGDSGYVVKPGDWILTNAEGRHFSCDAEFFHATFQPVE